MLNKILGWLVGGGISAIGEQINEWKRIDATAKNNSERIEAQKQIAYLEGRRDVLIAEQGSWMTRWIRPAFAFPFVVYDMKVLIWDKTLGWGVTDDLSPEFWQLQMFVFGAYFLTRSLEKR